MAAHYHSLTEIHLLDSWLTIGTFDGIHLGHQTIVRSLVEKAHQEKKPAVVLTFHPHPTLVLSGSQKSYYLTLPEQRARLLFTLGVDVVITYPFTRDTTQLSAFDFISLVHNHLNFTQLWIGHDFTLGKDREGDASRLTELGEYFGFQLEQIPALSLNGKRVSSSVIRQLLQEGRVQEAAEFLGRPFSLAGKVVPGDHRGKSLGFPTANLAIPDEMVDLRSGVYACFADINDRRWQAVTNIGYRPTFGISEGQAHIEAHLLDFNQEVYGQQMELFFISRLRNEKKFFEIKHLQTQINQDILRARGIFQDL